MDQQKVQLHSKCIIKITSLPSATGGQPGPYIYYLGRRGQRTDGAILDFRSRTQRDCLECGGRQQLQARYRVLIKHKRLKDLPRDHPALEITSVWDNLSTEDYLPGLYHGRIFLPQEAIKKVLEILHIQHLGAQKTLKNARALYFLQNIDK